MKDSTTLRTLLRRGQMHVPGFVFLFFLDFQQRLSTIHEMGDLIDHLDGYCAPRCERAFQPTA